MYISIDLGGTNTRVAASEDCVNILKELKFPTVFNADEHRVQILLAIDKVSKGASIKGISIGVPGWVDRENRIIRKLANLNSFNDMTFSEVLGGKFPGGLIHIENDAALAGLAEANLGAGKEYDTVAYLTISTGVGGIRIRNKKIDTSYAYAEPGHMIINIDGNLSEGCQQHGCLEAYVSGTAFKNIYGFSAEDCNDLAIWEKYAHHLAIGLGNVIAMWSPSVIVLGGGVSNKFEQYILPSLKKEIEMQSYFEFPPIIQSSFMDNAGLIGGFILLSQSYNS